MYPLQHEVHHQGLPDDSFWMQRAGRTNIQEALLPWHVNLHDRIYMFIWFPTSWKIPLAALNSICCCAICHWTRVGAKVRAQPTDRLTELSLNRASASQELVCMAKHPRNNTIALEKYAIIHLLTQINMDMVAKLLNSRGETPCTISKALVW